MSSILLVVSAPAAAVTTTTFTNLSSITINPASSPPTPAVASPYPSTIAVTGLTGNISNLTVTLSGISGQSVQDYSALLVGPDSQSLVLFAGVGPNSPAGPTDGLNVTLDDTGSDLYSTAGADLPTSGSVTMVPTDLASEFSGSDLGVFPSPAPTGLEAAPTGSATLASTFGGTNPNGTWSLYVDDDSNDNGGSLAGGWSLNITAGAQTVAFTSSAPTDAAVGGSTYTPTATASSGLPVSFSIDTSSAGACSIDSGVVSFTAAGNCVIDANQAGDGDYNPAPEAQQTVAVGPGSQWITVTSSPPADATVGGPGYTPSATGGGSGEPVVFSIDPSSSTVCSIGGGVVSFTAAGTCVIDANQAGNSNYTAAPQVQEPVTVAAGSQTISFTSGPPSNTTVDGPAYTPTATGGSSGEPVVISIAPSSGSVCSIGGGVVSFTGAGTCLIDANQAGNSNYAAAPQVEQSITVQTRPSGTQLVVNGNALTVTVSGSGPTPSGSVTFTVNGTVVRTAQLNGGTATLSYSFAPGQTYTVVAEYSGDGAYATSYAAAAYTAPSSTSTSTGAGTRPTGTKKLAPLKITLKLSSSRPEQHGWWTAAVTVTFTCTRAGKRVAKCPRPLRLDKSGNHVVNGHKINIDLGKPSLRIVGLNAGATYLVSVPAPGCHAHDAISGIRSCSISEKVIGRATGEQTLRFTARAVSGAGTVTSRSVTVSEQQLGLIGLVSSTTGIYAVNTARTYTLEVASRTKPLYVEGAVAPQRPVGAHNWFVLNGHSDGVPLWQLSVLLPSGLNQDTYWNIGVQIGNTIRIIAIRD